MTTSIEVTGIKETQRALYGYSQQLGDRVVISALRQGANVVKRAIAALTPVYKGPQRKGVVKGALKRGFSVRKSKIHNGKFSNSKIGVYLAPRKIRNGGRGTRDPFYARWIEAGWNTRGKAAGSGGRSQIVASFGSRTGRKSLPGKTNVPGRFFVRRGFESSKHNAVRTIERAVVIGANIVKKKVGLR